MDPLDQPELQEQQALQDHKAQTAQMAQLDQLGQLALKVVVLHIKVLLRHPRVFQRVVILWGMRTQH
jgi:hypothetical protein